MLNTEHNYVCSHSWCTKSDGKFLKFFMDVLQKKMNDKLLYTDDLRQMYEQCVYCLYGHPNKKGRAKHLADHNCQPISLTLQQAIHMFEYFKPKNLPEFDSFKTDTVSAEVCVCLCIARMNDLVLFVFDRKSKYRVFALFMC